MKKCSIRLILKDSTLKQLKERFSKIWKRNSFKEKRTKKLVSTHLKSMKTIPTVTK